MALVSRLSQVTGYYSADGHYARTLPRRTSSPTTTRPDQLKPIYNNPEQQYDFYTSRPGVPLGFQRCPGAASQPAEDGSTPFVEGAARRRLRPAPTFPPGP